MPFSFSVKLLQLTLALFILLVLIICVAFQVFLLADKKPIVRSQDLLRMACNYITEDTGLAQHNFEVKNLQRANFSRIAEPHAGLTNEANGLIHPRGDPPPKTKPTKGLNLHFWRFPFGSSTCVRKYVFLWFLCKHPFFPKYPSKTLRLLTKAKSSGLARKDFIKDCWVLCTLKYQVFINSLFRQTILRSCGWTGKIQEELPTWATRIMQYARREENLKNIKVKYRKELN